MICASIKEVAVLITARAVKIEVVVRTRSMTALQMTVVGLEVGCDCLGFANLVIKSGSAVHLLVPGFKPMVVKPEKGTESNCECSSTCFSNSSRDVEYQRRSYGNGEDNCCGRGESCRSNSVRSGCGYCGNFDR